MKKRFLAFALCLTLALSLAACSGGIPAEELPAPDAATPSPTPEPTPRPSESGLVLAVVSPDEATLELLSLCGQAGLEVTVREYDNIGAMLADVADDFPPDMFYLPALGEYDERIAQLCLDLTGYLESDSEYSQALLPGLRQALNHGGSLPYIAYDFTMECFASSPDAGVLTVDGAMALASERGVELFPTYWNRTALTSFALPYMQAVYGGEEPSFDGGQFAALLDAIASRGDESGVGESLLEYMQLSPVAGVLSALDGEEGFGLAGLPGDDSASGLFAAEHCFGILKTCSDPDGAWQYLRALLGTDAQGMSAQFPSTSVAFSARLAELVSSGGLSEAASAEIAELAANTHLLYAAEDYTGELIRAAVEAVAGGEMTSAEAASEVQRLALEHLTGG